MRFYIVIPAHNEEAFIKDCLVSLSEQSLVPEKIIVVDDNSSDQTSKIVEGLIKQYPFIEIMAFRVPMVDVSFAQNKVIL